MQLNLCRVGVICQNGGLLSLNSERMLGSLPVGGQDLGETVSTVLVNIFEPRLQQISITPTQDS